MVAESENGEFKRQSELYTRHRRKLPTESNDQTNNLDDDVPLQEYQGNDVALVKLIVYPFRT